MNCRAQRSPRIITEYISVQKGREFVIQCSGIRQAPVQNNNVGVQQIDDGCECTGEPVAIAAKRLGGRPVILRCADDDLCGQTGAR